jgi:hypothetical protein
MSSRRTSDLMFGLRSPKSSGRRCPGRKKVLLPDNGVDDLHFRAVGPRTLEAAPCVSSCSSRRAWDRVDTEIAEHVAPHEHRGRLEV